MAAAPSDAPARLRLDPKRLRTPRGHGDVLLEPSPAVLREAIRHNQSLWAGYDFRLLDVDVSSARRQARSAFADSDDQPLIACGHQPDFVHPGVWAKHVIVQRLAAATGGKAINLVVDNDAPKSPYLELPDYRGDQVAVRRVRVEGWQSHTAFEHVAAAASQSEALVQVARQSLGDRYDGTLMAEFLAGYGAGANGRDWVDQALGGRCRAEQSLGVRLADYRVSRVWGGPLLGQLIVDARRFAECYNRSVQGYRTAHAVRGHQRPVPDLISRDDRVEVAAWVYRAGKPRKRLLVGFADGALTLFADEAAIGQIAASEAQRWERLEAALNGLDGWCVRPRALTLTLWARLLVADLFVHGIGGAQYDQITDEIMRSYFGIEPPVMACASATLQMRPADRPAAIDAVRRLRHRLRDLTFNPQRHIDDTGVQELAAARANAVRQSQRLRELDRHNRSARREVYRRIHGLNERMLAANPEVRDQLCRELSRQEQAAAGEAIGLRRDFFFCLYDRGDLTMLLDRLCGVRDLR